MTDFHAGDEGEWQRVQSGDFCMRCRRAHRHRFTFKYDIAGIDTFLPHPRIRQCEPPRQKPVCKCGPDCCEHDAEHFAKFSHPWLMAGPIEYEDVSTDENESSEPTHPP